MQDIVHITCSWYFRWSPVKVLPTSVVLSFLMHVTDVPGSPSGLRETLNVLLFMLFSICFPIVCLYSWIYFCRCTGFGFLRDYAWRPRQRLLSDLCQVNIWWGCSRWRWSTEARRCPSWGSTAFLLMKPHASNTLQPSCLKSAAAAAAVEFLLETWVFCQLIYFTFSLEFF